MTYFKVRFTSKNHGATAGLIVKEKDVTTVSDLSRLFPKSEFRKMERLEISQPYKTLEEAFNHSFDNVGA